MNMGLAFARDPSYFRMTTQHIKILGKKGIARTDRIAQAYDRESNRPVTVVAPMNYCSSLSRTSRLRYRFARIIMGII